MCSDGCPRDQPADLVSFGTASEASARAVAFCVSEKLTSLNASGGRVCICEIERSISKSRLQSSITRTLLLKPTSLARYSVRQTSHAKKPESLTPSRCTAAKCSPTDTREP